MKIAKSEPQAAYSSFTSGFRHKTTYFMRTIPNIENEMSELDRIIDEEFLPAITEGHNFSADERRLVSLPVRMGGLGIPIFSELCTREFYTSKNVTKQLSENIVKQNAKLSIDVNKQKETESKMRSERNELDKQILDSLRTKMTKEQVRANDLAQLKGASAWLNSLPLKEEGYNLNKREFFDALALRYRWDMKRLPFRCGCTKKERKVTFEVDHAMNCLKGGFIHKRHDGVRDIMAQAMNDVAYDVCIEPPLQPLSGESLSTGVNVEEEARLDIKARGFWNRDEMAFFDVRIFNPFAKSYLNTKIETVFRQQEAEKKREYGERVIRIEHGSFTPLVMSAYGGCGVETSRCISKLVDKISEKFDMDRSNVANYIRTKLSFHLVRSQVLCIRGSRSIRVPKIDLGEVEYVQGLSEIRQ